MTSSLRIRCCWISHFCCSLYKYIKYIVLVHKSHSGWLKKERSLLKTVCKQRIQRLCSICSCLRLKIFRKGINDSVVRIHMLVLPTYFLVYALQINYFRVDRRSIEVVSVRVFFLNLLDIFWGHVFHFSLLYLSLISLILFVVCLFCSAVMVERCMLLYSGDALQNFWLHTVKSSDRKIEGGSL